MNLKIGEQIANLRKKRELTQEELAKILGVTNQAVSKWESNKCCPDIELLPVIAETFKCSIDTLFGTDKAFREGGNTYELCSELPWADDEIIRGVICKGKKILDIQSGVMHKFTFEYIGEAKSVKSHCNLSILGNVSGDCNAGHNISVGGIVSGGCQSGHSIAVGGNVSGGCQSRHSIAVGATVNGAVACGNTVECKGNIIGDVEGQNITVDGDVTSKKIIGNVNCKTLKCDDVEGEVKIN